MPLTKTSVEEQPCLNPGKVSEKGQSYPLEIERNVEFCDIDKAFRVSHDERYIDTAMRISEYELQKDSGVLEAI